MSEPLYSYERGRRASVWKDSLSLTIISYPFRRYLPLIAAVVFLLTVVGASAVALGAPRVCAKYDQVADNLKKKFGEMPVAGGLSPGGKSIWSLMLSEGGSFSIVQVMPSGLTCVIATGKDWHDLPSPFGSKT